ncbi:hypothetical protein MMC32_002603 [Xylographa parallela]|nr:hypothetical protein [Xylographa parallela]
MSVTTAVSSPSHSTIYTMTSTTLTSRFDAYVAAHNSHDIVRLMSLMAPDVEYSNYGVETLQMDTATPTPFFTNMNESCGDMTPTPRSCHDSETFTTWEWDLEFKYLKPSPTLPGVEARGQVICMKGVSLIWWVRVSDDWKVERGSNYACLAKESLGGSG